jgi:HD-GYP domain-containing protein (c-di-GMP phosphodiesterase class II)
LRTCGKRSGEQLCIAECTAGGRYVFSAPRELVEDMRMSAQAVGVEGSDGVRLGRFLPLSIGVTAVVTAVPLLVVSQLGPARGVPTIALHVLAAAALSVVLARALATLWTRHEQSSDLVFGDLLLWGWVRRALAERRLNAATNAIEALTAAGEDRSAMLRRMSALLEARDPYTHGHSRRVARHAERIAVEMGLPREQVAKIRSAALVHDIGKINVPRPILTKPGKLTDSEFALVKRHPGDGAAMVESLGDAELTAVVRHHHERMDGTGYPDGLAGDDIPIGARVISVADTFDAITSARAYRKPRTHKQAIEILQREAGAQLDAAAVGAFVTYYAARRSVGFVSVLAAAPQRLLSGLGGVQSGVAAGVAPIAQTACGVGGVALIGACLGGSALPASTTTSVHRDGTHRQLAAQTAVAPSQSGPTRESRQAGGRSHRRGTHRTKPRGSISAPTQGSAPRSFRAPNGVSPDGGQQNTGGGGGGNGGGGTVPTVPSLPRTPDLPALPDVETVLDPVTDVVQGPQLKVPQVNPPQPLPQVGLP